MRTKSFLGQAIRHPFNIGAVLPSSRRLVDLMIRSASLDEAEYVVELGPGTGVVTHRIHQTMNGRGKFLCIEQNAMFVQLMQQSIPELDLVHGSAEALPFYLEQRRLSHCDRVLSGLPWTNFSTGVQDRLLGSIASALNPGGLFLTLAYQPMASVFRGRRFKEKLLNHFGDVEQTKVVFLNLPPSSVYVCSNPLKAQLMPAESMFCREERLSM